MSFEIPPIYIPDNSPEAQAVEQVMQAQHIGPEEAVRTILRSADKRNPAQRMIGLFSSDEDAAIMDDVMELVEEGRKTQTTREA
ncbi:MAG TPA: hypothetical protein VGL56_02105 [Fimbriimonadaceae bacterium]